MTVHRVFGYHLRQLRKHDWHLSMRHAAWVEHDSFQSLSIVQKLQFLRTMALLVCTFSYVKYLTMQLSWIEKVMATNSLINSKIFHYILCNTAQKCFHWWSQSGKHQIFHQLPVSAYPMDSPYEVCEVLQWSRNSYDQLVFLWWRHLFLSDDIWSVTNILIPALPACFQNPFMFIII